MVRIFFLICTSLLTRPVTGLGQLALASVFSNNMILQRNQPIPIWGRGVPGEKVTIDFFKKQYTSSVGADSSWIVHLDRMPAVKVPQSMKIVSAAGRITLINIVVGDVWFCFGQSNMEFPLKNEQHFLPQKNNYRDSLMRIFHTDYPGKNIYNQAFSEQVLQALAKPPFFEGNWQMSDEKTLLNMSAVAYYFGSTLRKYTTTPIGLINAAVGGLPVESLISPELLKNKYPQKLSRSWLENDHLPIWVRERGLQNIPIPVHAPGDKHGPYHPFKPGYVYTYGMIDFFKLPIAGLLFYQGESNAQEIDRVLEYKHLVKDMVMDFRQQWKQNNLPFYFVQLSSIDSVKYKSQFWPDFRCEQENIMDLIPHSGMALSWDAGHPSDVHPKNKKIVGERLARWALKDFYHQKISAVGPEPCKAVSRKNDIILRFKHSRGGLITSDGAAVVRGFTDETLNPWPGRISGRTLKFESAGKVSQMRYAWQPYATGNLINRDSLPTSSFKILVQ